MVFSHPVTVVILLTMSYCLFIPFPDHASNPLGKSATAALKKLQRITISAGEMVGLNVEVPLARFLDRVSASWQQDNPDVQSRYVDLGGVKALVQRPKSADKEARLPCIIYYHGGGWITGSTASYRAFTGYMSNLMKAVVISVEYRLAPEHVFPVPFEDSLKATRYVIDHPDELGIDAKKLGLAGDENGGTLALTVGMNVSYASATVKRRDRHWAILGIGIFYAPLQMFDYNLPSYVKYGDGPGYHHKTDIIRQQLYHLFGYVNQTLLQMLSSNLHTTKEMRSMKTDQFSIHNLPFSFRSDQPPDSVRNNENIELAEELEKLIFDYRVSPMLLNLKQYQIVPATYQIAAEFDPLRDEAFMFYGFVREWDVNTRYHEYYRSEQHGFLMEYESNKAARDALLGFVIWFHRECSFKHWDSIDEPDIDELIPLA